MQNPNSFTIYDASAGSGKTFTLVKAYLKILFQSNSLFQFKNILAITFTNKAVYEMKERIINTLKMFSDVSILTSENTMFKLLCEELNLEPEALYSKSNTLLNTIIHNYAAFEISTIDGFTHRLIRTFAHDLKLPLNFEVELDTDSLLTEAVDRLIAKAGTDKELTKILVQYAIEKADDDKSWDISLDLYKIAKLLVNENDIPYLNNLQGKSLEDFKILKQHLKTEINSTEEFIVSTAKNLLSSFANQDLTVKDFSRGTLYNHFVKASKLELYNLYDNKLESNITEGKIYTKSLAAAKAQLIDELLPEIATKYQDIKSKVFHLKLLRTIYKNITQLSVLNAINNELTDLKNEENKMLISEFNTIIGNEISEQPTPFIYERLGEKFNHYFIDEFQDTSELQWKNLVPLISETLDHYTPEKDPGSLMLVGDAKQAIYRWRGGKAEQFIELADLSSNPFHTEKQKSELKTNFRSFKNVIEFNNSFFRFLTTTAFSNTTYQDLYNRAGQETANPNEGFVNITFLNTTDEDRDVIYPEQVLKTINSCLENGYSYKDLCILVRKGKEAAAIADFLSQQNIQIISSESLLLKKSPEVIFVNNIISLLFDPRNNEVKIEILKYLSDKFGIEDKHAFFEKHLNLEINQLFSQFSLLNIFVKAEQLIQLPLFDMAESIIRDFNLVSNSNAYLQYYLDVILDFSQKQGSDIFKFLEYFNKKMDKLSIVSPEGQNAVQIMTIHKSKGLEFPVVIFPYADLDIYKEVDPKTWFPLDANNYKGFSNALINYSKKDIVEFGEDGKKIYNTRNSELELDNLNLLYVTLTRPVEQLHIISSLGLDRNGNPNTNLYSGLFIAYLKEQQLWSDSTQSYSFGTATRPISETDMEAVAENHSETIEFISESKQEHNIKIITKNGYLWDTVQQDAIEKGNLVHHLMSKIKTAQDILPTLESAKQDGLINTEQEQVLQDIIINIVNHNELKTYYSETNTIYTERDIITKSGSILRPDRIVISPQNEVIIIDYKTGTEQQKHKEQLQMYQHYLEDMNFKVTQKILVYINEDIQIKYA
ncbi:UvrD-helicase domain-containing protein [Formosa sp. S-31]|uniref:UvrD-helicase domain-containing protein n=1 Tax=Formosa sp. S-31 TaxID=2790949 RepID=UPI003EBBA0B5